LIVLKKTEVTFFQHRFLKQGSYAERIGEGAPVYMGKNLPFFLFYINPSFTS
jgi:hypothetical protein